MTDQFWCARVELWVVDKMCKRCLHYFECEEETAMKMIFRCRMCDKAQEAKTYYDQLKLHANGWEIAYTVDNQIFGLCPTCAGKQLTMSLGGDKKVDVRQQF